jgi:hypothetical protein
MTTPARMAGAEWTGVRERPVRVSLPTMALETLARLGQGNVSAGARRLLRASAPTPNAEPDVFAPAARQSRPQQPPDIAPANIARLQAAKGGIVGRAFVRFLDSCGWYDEDSDDDDKDDEESEDNTPHILQQYARQRIEQARADAQRAERAWIAVQNLVRDVVAREAQAHETRRRTH